MLLDITESSRIIVRRHCCLRLWFNEAVLSMRATVAKSTIIYFFKRDFNLLFCCLTQFASVGGRTVKDSGETNSED